MALVDGTPRTRRDEAVIERALALLDARIREPGALLTNVAQVKSFIRILLGQRDAESFWVLYTDAKNRLLSADEMFRGTITRTAVYPREIARRALFHNAAGAILVHNHPSGDPSPSTDDIQLTDAIARVLEYVDVVVLDHLIVAGREVLSFREAGLMSANL